MRLRRLPACAYGRGSRVPADPVDRAREQAQQPPGALPRQQRREGDGVGTQRQDCAVDAVSSEYISYAVIPGFGCLQVEVHADAQTQC